MLIINAKIFTCDGGRVIEHGFVRTNGGIISDVGDMHSLTALPREETLDAEGGFLLPGLVDAHSHIGVWEECIGQEGDDANEASDPCTPHIRALDAVNSRDPAFSDALSGGVTAVVTGPGSSNPIGGQSAAFKTYGAYADEMLVKAPCAMKMALGENPKHVFSDKEDAPYTRMATAAIIREALFKAREYAEKFSDTDSDDPDFDIRCEALMPVVTGELPVHFHAHRADDIMTAVRLASEFNLRFAVIHASEAHLVTAPLSALGDNFLGLITGPLFGTRSKPELSNMTFALPGIVSAAGIRTALCTDHQVVPSRYLMLCAALAAKNGMSERDAFEAVTINAARISGIDDRCGSISRGKDADLVVYNRHPFDISADIKVIAGGARVK